MSNSQLSNDPYRLAFVITELEVGGAERCLTNLVLGLDKTRFTAEVYSLWPRPVSNQCELVNRLEKAGIPVHFLGLRVPRHFHRGSWRLHRLLAQQRPHLMQTFLFHANTIGAIAGWRMKIPRIVQGIRVADRSAWRMVLERISARLVNRIVCVSDSVAAMARDEVRLPADKLSVIPNGIDVAPFPAEQAADLTSFGVPANRRVIVAIGRLHAQKGMDWLVQVAPRILADCPDTDMVIAGHGPEEAALRREAESRQVASRVHFVGWQPDVPAILKRASLFVLPSRWEGMPNALLEAMASGLPVVATQVEGVAEVLGPLAQDQLVRFGDDDAFVGKIASILREPQRGHELGEQNRRRIHSEYALDRMISRYEQLYGELLQSLASR